MIDARIYNEHMQALATTLNELAARVRQLEAVQIPLAGVLGPHDILSATHPDTTVAAVIRGDLMTGQGLVPTWTRLALGAANTVLTSDGTDAAWQATAAVNHNLLSAVHPDTAPAAVVDGDVIIGNATPNWQRLAVSIPAANVRNVLGVDNGELRPSWKAALDAVAPTAITAGAVGAAGTALIFSHRDHQHATPATWTATAHNLLSAIHGDTTAAAAVRGDVITAQGAGALWTRLAISAPAATFMNYLGTANGDTEPGYKALFDANVPTTIAAGAAAAPGTATVAARRDHTHGAPATYPATAHALLSATHSDTTVQAVTRGSLIYGNSTPAWDELVIGGASGSIVTRDANDVLWSAYYLSGTAAQTYTFPATSTTLQGGTGSSTQVAYWSATANILAGDAGLTVDAANDMFIVANDGGIGISNADEKLEFWSAGYATFSGCNVGINDATPDELLHITSSDSRKPVILIENTNADEFAPRVTFYKNSASPADDDSLGVVNFYGEDSGGTQERFAYIVGISEDVTDTDEGGSVAFYVIMNSTERQILKLSGYNGVVNQGEIILNESGQDVDTRIEAAGVADALQVRGSDGQITLGVLTAGYVNSDAGGVLSVTATATPTAHAILSASHSDAAVDAVTRGSLIVGNSTPAWDELNHPAAANRILRTPDANDVSWSDWALIGTAAQTYTFGTTGGTIPTAAGTLTTATANAITAAGVITHAITNTSDGAANHSTILSSSAAGEITMDDYFTVDGGQFGIAGNELLTVNAAGTFAFSGISGVTVEDDDYIGIAGDVRIVFDSSSGFIEATLGDAAGSDEFQVVDSGGVAVATIDSNGQGYFADSVGIATLAPSTTNGGLDIASGGLGLIVGADNGAITRTNVTDKYARVGIYHYTNAEEPIALAVGISTLADNTLRLGGGSATLNAATLIQFYTAANTTTTTGTEQARFTSAGYFLVGATAGSAQVYVDQASTTGAVPALYLDQGDVSEQHIVLSMNGADQDFPNILQLNVTGSPALWWDESENAFGYKNISGLLVEDDAWIGVASNDIRINFDSSDGDIMAILGDAAGNDEFQVVDSGSAVVAFTDSNGAGYYADGLSVGTNTKATGGDIYLTGQLGRSTDTNTYLDFPGADNAEIVCGGSSMMDAYYISANVKYVDLVTTAAIGGRSYVGTGLGGAATTVASGVTTLVSVTGLLLHSSGNAVSVAEALAPGGSVLIYNNGGNQVTLSVTVGGTCSVSLSAGAGTFDVTFSVRWV